MLFMNSLFGLVYDNPQTLECLTTIVQVVVAHLWMILMLDEKLASIKQCAQ
jgi:hypothetical protein